MPSCRWHGSSTGCLLGIRCTQLRHQTTGTCPQHTHHTRSCLRLQQSSPPRMALQICCQSRKQSRRGMGCNRFDLSHLPCCGSCRQRTAEPRSRRQHNTSLLDIRHMPWRPMRFDTCQPRIEHTSPDRHCLRSCRVHMACALWHQQRKMSQTGTMRNRSVRSHLLMLGSCRLRSCSAHSRLEDRTIQRDNRRMR